MLKNNVSQQMKEALKAHDEVRLSTMRMLLTALSYAEIEKQDDLTEEDEIDVVRKEAKKRRDAIEAYDKGGRPEKAEQERQELKILQEFLPQELTNEELLQMVTEAIQESGAQRINDMGKVMGIVMKKTAGRADGTKISALVREKLV